MERTKRLPKGTLVPLSEAAGIAGKYLSDIVNCRKRPGRKTALVLEKAARTIGWGELTTDVWLYGDPKDKIHHYIGG